MMSIREPLFNSDFSDVAFQEKTPQLSFEEAKALRDDIRKDWDVIQERINVIRPKIYRLWQGKGWKTLGYQSWRQCVLKEFPSSPTHLYRELNAAKVEAILSSGSTIKGAIPEKTLRPLTALLKEPETLKGVYEEAKDENGNVTGKKIRELMFKRNKLETGTRGGIFLEFEAIMRRLNRLELLINEQGGFEDCAKDWSRQRLDYARETLDRYHETFGKWREGIRNR